MSESASEPTKIPKIATANEKSDDEEEINVVDDFDIPVMKPEKRVENIEEPPVKRKVIVRIIRRKRRTSPAKESENSSKKNKVSMDSSGEITENPQESSESLRCSLCNERGLLISFRTRDDKLFVLVGELFSGRLNENEAILRFFAPQSGICMNHFTDTTFRLLSILEVHSPLEVLNASYAKIGVIKTHAQTIGGQIMKLEQIRQSLCLFAAKYPSELLNRSTLLPKAPVSAPSADPILPKNCRQPRKQVFEDHNSSDSIVRIIESEQFHLPGDHVILPQMVLKEPRLCCFCLKILERAKMIKVPMSQNRLELWLVKLGPAFQTRLRSDGFNFMCRAHFSKDSFSCKGRLLKGSLPETVGGPRIAVEFRIDGDEFVKVGGGEGGPSEETKTISN